MDQTAPFEVLVVDEAAQSVEVSTIIPLRCALVNVGENSFPREMKCACFSATAVASPFAFSSQIWTLRFIDYENLRRVPLELSLVIAVSVLGE